MATITTPLDYTIGDTKIPNAVTGNPGEGLNGDLAYLIEKSERSLLVDCLGYDAFVQLQDELLKSPFVPEAVEVADDLWVHLVNGNGEWQGIKPIVKNYVYCQWTRESEITVTTTGAGKSKVRLMHVTDFNQKYVMRWNEFVRQISDLSEYLSETEGLEMGRCYPSFRFENQFGL